MYRPFALARVATVSLGVILSGSAGAQNVANNQDGIRPPNLAPGSAEPTRGVVFFTAAINSDGSIASCFACVPARTKRIGVGKYQIDFGENVQAVNGWSRWVQADALTTGSEDAWCNTADRAGNPNAVVVNCQHSGGRGSHGTSAPIDASFFLFVAR